MKITTILIISLMAIALMLSGCSNKQEQTTQIAKPQKIINIKEKEPVQNVPQQTTSKPTSQINISVNSQSVSEIASGLNDTNNAQIELTNNDVDNLDKEVGSIDW